MSARASILWGGSPGPVTNLAIGTPIVLSNDNLGDETSYLWSLQRPAQSSAVLVDGPGANQKTLTPDVYGTYAVRLLVNGLYMDISAGAVLYPSGLREPLLGESSEWSSTKGWAGSAADLWKACGMGVPLLGLTSKSSTGGLTASECIGKIVRGVTSGGAVELTLPDLNDAHYDFASGVIARAGANNLTITAPVGATLRAPGAVGSSYVLGSDGEMVRFYYDQTNNTFYLLVSNASGSGGETNTASNVGGAIEVFKQKLLVDLQFRTLTTTTPNVVLTQNTSTVAIDAGVTDTTTVSATGAVTSTQVKNKLVLGDTSGGAVDITLPALTASDDNTQFPVARSGGSLLRLLTPSASYYIKYPGYANDQVLEFPSDGDSATLLYKHATQTYYVVG